MKPSRVMVTTIWPGSIRLSSSWSAAASAISVIRGVAISARDRGEFLAHHLHAPRRGEARISSRSLDLFGDLGQFRLDLLALQPGQPLQPQVQDAARLLLGQAHRAVVGRRYCRDPRSAPAAAARRSAGQSRSISAARAAAASGLARIRRITSSILATAIARPTSRCARSRALREIEAGRGGGSPPRGSG